MKSTRATTDASGMSRRALLKLAGFGATAATFGACRRESSDPPGGDPLDGSTSEWDELRRKMKGSLLLPGDLGYDGARRAYNPLFDNQRPAAVAECATPSDVQACIDMARRHHVRLAARSGGHSYGGYSTPDGGLVVDVGRLSRVEINGDGSVIVGAGARLIDVYAALAASGRCLPAGSCPTVGIAGLTLGGGMGVLSRKYGLTCDALVSADIVLADGSRRTANAHADADLYWALRGGGGGNFGIVTSFTFRTQPAPSLTVFELGFPPGSVREVFGAWQSWQPHAPNELWSNCVLSAGNPTGVFVGGCFVGSAADLAPHLDELARIAGVQPTSRSSTEKSHMDAMMYFAGCSTLTVEECRVRSEADAGAGRLDRASFVASSRILSVPVDPGSVANLMRERTGFNLLIDALGGAVRDVGPDGSAFPHRRAIATMQIYAAATPESREAVEQNVTEVQSALAQITGPGAYVNYIDPRMPEWAGACYGANLARLQQVNKIYDADGVFAFPQSISNA